ncbi:MAG TPA: hypothetical protein VD771_03780 [Gemmatimonadaceae bacterium]|nr:hypothetical protein [Gemmatimonadaceae bacterium]
MTKARPTAIEPPQAVREILRRAGHEIRNALNGVSVNVEVVRSRAARDASPKDLTSFADRASAQVSEASALTDGLLALLGAILAGQSDGTLKTAVGAGSRIELTIYGEAASSIVSDIERLTSRIGVGLEQDGQSVILRILPQGQSHS